MKNKFMIFSNDQSLKVDRISKQILADYQFIEISEISQADFVFIIGGDGTYIKYIKYVLGKYDFKGVFVLINRGHVGYHSIVDYRSTLSDLKSFISKNYTHLQEGNYTTLTYSSFKVNDQIFINEFSLLTSLTLVYDLKINEDYFPICSSGIVVSTTYGSSGLYSSLNGPICLNSTNLLLIKHVAPLYNKRFRNNVRDCVINMTDNISLSIEGFNDRKQYIYDFNLDGKSVSFDSHDLKFEKFKEYKILNNINDNELSFKHLTKLL